MYLVIYSREAQRGGGDVDDRAGCTVVEVVEMPCGGDCEIARYDCGTWRSFEDHVSRTTCLGGHRPRPFMGIFRDTGDLRSASETSEIARPSLNEQ